MSTLLKVLLSKPKVIKLSRRKLIRAIHSFSKKRLYSHLNRLSDKALDAIYIKEIIPSLARAKAKKEREYDEVEVFDTDTRIPKKQLEREARVEANRQAYLKKEREELIISTRLDNIMLELEGKYIVSGMKRAEFLTAYEKMEIEAKQIYAERFPS